MKNIIGLIPARYASTRFPGKPLVDIAGKPMIRRVYERASECKDLSRVIVATDDDRIAEVVKSFGGDVCMTDVNHPSGTDRCAQVVEDMHLACDAVINIQGDEPFIDPRQISLVASCFSDESTPLATLIKPIMSEEVLFSPNSPKVVVDQNGYALYFSRHPIPYLRGQEQAGWIATHKYYQHIGIYGYRRDALAAITKLAPSSLEKAESLEQLRWLENGFKIKTAVTDIETMAIDTPDDLTRILKQLKLK